MQIEVRKISKSYGRIHAVESMSFTLEPRHVTALVGPNGAGKSTLLSLMAGRILPDCGDVLYDGISIYEDPEKVWGKIGLMPDALAANSSWEVLPYLDYYARAYGLKGDDRHNRVKQTIDFMRLEPLLERHLSELSKGMRQRISLARILMGNPDILLLDEPASGLDARARVELLEDIRQLAARGKTIVISSHILSELQEVCDDLLIMETGRLLRHGSLAELSKLADLPASPQHTGAASTGNAPVLTAKPLQKIRLRLDPEPENLPDALARLPHYLSCGKDGHGGWILCIDEGEDSLREFMTAAFQTQLPIVEYQKNAWNLESLFMNLTSGKIQ